MEDYEIAKEEREREEDRVRSLADIIYERGNGSRAKNKQEYGLCGRCRFLCYQRSGLNNEFVWCENGEGDPRKAPLKPNKVDPITDCSFFEPAGIMSMWDMNRIAWKIDVEDRDELGFGGGKNRVVTIRRP